MLLLKLSLRPWRLAPYSQIFSALAVGLLLVMAGFLYWMQKGLKPVVTRLQQEQVITAYLDSSLEAGSEKKIVDAIHTQIGLAQVGARSDFEINYVAPKDFVSKLKGQYPELAREIEGLGAEMDYFVPKYISISGIIPDGALSQIRQIPGVEAAESSKDRYRSIVGAFMALRWVARLLVFGLAVALFTGLIHLARMNAYLHRDALALVRLMGAHGLILRAPGVLSGLAVGWVGGLIACTAWMSGGPWLARQIHSLSPMLRDMPVFPARFGIELLIAGGIVGILAGIFAGIAGAMTASRSEAG